MENKKYTCDICNKLYKSYKSLWFHKYKHHKNSKPESKSEIDISKPESKPKMDIGKPEVSQNKLIIDNKYKCKFCSKEYKFKQSKWNHEQKCNKKNYVEDLKKELEEKDKEIEEIKQSFEKFKKQMLDMMNQKYKMHHKTFQKMINSNNINSNNNITINNIKYVEFGKEELHNVFSKEEKLMLLNKKGSTIEHIVRYTHLNDKFPQFQNIIITNIRSNQAYAYNDKINKFILCDKNDLLEEMIITTIG